jgi:hypothetical protein
LHVASIATSSSGPRLSNQRQQRLAYDRHLAGVLTRPSSHTATCANSRCTSRPMHLRPTTHLLTRRWSPREQAGEGHLRIRARCAPGLVARAAKY